MRGDDRPHTCRDDRRSGSGARLLFRSAARHAARERDLHPEHGPVLLRSPRNYATRVRCSCSWKSRGSRRWSRHSGCTQMARCRPITRLARAGTPTGCTCRGWASRRIPRCSRRRPPTGASRCRPPKGCVARARPVGTRWWPSSERRASGSELLRTRPLGPFARRAFGALLARSRHRHVTRSPPRCRHGRACGTRRRRGP